MGDLKEMCELLKKEKAEAERKLGNVRGVSNAHVFQNVVLKLKFMGLLIIITTEMLIIDQKKIRKNNFDT